MVDHSNFWDVLILDDLQESYLKKASDFLQSYLPKGVDPNWSPEYFRWKLEKNPAGRGFMTCAVSSNGDVVGVTSITPKKLWYENRVVTAAEIGDTYTHPSFLKKGRFKRAAKRDPIPGKGVKEDYFDKSIFGRLVKETRERAERSGITVIYGTPNENSRPGYEKRLNFRAHPSAEIETYVRPTAEGICSRYPVPRLFHALVRWVGKIPESALSLYWSLIGKAKRYSIVKVDKPTEGFDRLWDELKHQYRFSIVHDKEFFQHRFFDHPLGKYQVYKTACKGKICGVFVVRTFNDFNGKKCCVLADWIYDELKPKLFPVMLAHAIDHNRKNGIQYYSAWAGQNGAEKSALKGQGFFPRGTCPVIFYLNDEGSAVLQNGAGLHFTVASTDNV